MGVAATKTRKSSSASRAQARKRPFFSHTGEGSFFKPVQTKMAVSHPGDKFEQEAESTADKVMRMADPAPDKVQRASDDKLQRQEKKQVQRKEKDTIQREEKDKVQRVEEDKIQREEKDPIQRKQDEKIQRAEQDKVQREENKDKVQRKQEAATEPREEEKIFRAVDDQVQRDSATGGGRAPAVTDHVQSGIARGMTGGEPLAADVRSYMEPRFDTDFSRVRVHHDGEAAGLSNRLGARAFTHQNHIFFSRGQYQPGTSGGNHLLAHELTHTMQQGHAVQRAPQPVSSTPATPTVQRLGISDVLDWFADKANLIPGFRLLTLVIGFNPINMQTVDRTGANLLRGLIELIPGIGGIITRVLDTYGVINKAAAWVESKMAQLSALGSGLNDALHRFLDSLGWTDIFHPGDVWDDAKRIFTEPIVRIKDFAINTGVELLKIVKDAILKPLATLAQGTRGYDLLCVLLGRDPISNEPKPPTAENLLGGFMTLIGQEEIWQNIQRGNAISRAYAWFQGALGGLMGMVNAVPQRIVASISSLTFQDIITLVGAFQKVVGTFVNIAAGFITWGLGTIWKLLEIVIDVVKPGLMGYIRRTGAALKSILRNPIPFMRNLIRAAQLGFNNFASHFVTHLKEGIIGWLTGSLQGVYLPKAVTLVELGKFALSVLGITWDLIRAKIVRALGPNGERTMQRLEQTVAMVRTLATGGITALWNMIKEKLTDLKDIVIDGIVSFITTTIITKAVPKLLALFIPGAGFISAIITIYDTIMVFVNKLATIARVVMAFVNSIVAIAAGKIAPAAARIESALAGLLTLAISFLAGFLGLSKIAEKVMTVVGMVRAKVDKAIGKMIEWVVGKARRLFGRVLGRGRSRESRRTSRPREGGPDLRTMQQKRTDLRIALGETQRLQQQPNVTERQIRQRLPEIKRRYRMRRLDLVVENHEQGMENVHIEGVINPPLKTNSSAIIGPTKTAKQAHNEVMSTMSGNAKRLLKGHGSYVPGHAGRGFTVETRNFLDDIGYASGDHSFPSIKSPGTRARPSTKWGKLNKGSWIPDHQPPDTLGRNGATVTYRFYPHSLSSARSQGGVVNSYRAKMIRQRPNLGGNKWAEGVKSQWFW